VGYSEGKDIGEVKGKNKQGKKEASYKKQKEASDKGNTQTKTSTNACEKSDIKIYQTKSSSLNTVKLLTQHC